MAATHKPAHIGCALTTPRPGRVRTQTAPQPGDAQWRREQTSQHAENGATTAPDNKKKKHRARRQPPGPTQRKRTQQKSRQAVTSLRDNGAVNRRFLSGTLPQRLAIAPGRTNRPAAARRRLARPNRLEVHAHTRRVVYLSGPVGRSSPPVLLSDFTASPFVHARNTASSLLLAAQLTSTPTHRSVRTCSRPFSFRPHRKQEIALAHAYLYAHALIRQAPHISGQSDTDPPSLSRQYHTRRMPLNNVKRNDLALAYVSMRFVHFFCQDTQWDV